MKKRLTGWCGGALFALTFLLSPGAWAGAPSASVGNAPGDGGLHTIHPFIAGPSSGWIVNPIEIIADPSAPNWIKTLQNPVTLTGVFGFTEFLTVGDGPNWTDWHETVVTPGWAWTDGDLLALIGVVLLADVDGNISPDGSSIDFFFDPLPPGTVVIINKTLTCIQTAPCVGDIEVREFPTIGVRVPEPGSLLLLAAGLLGLAGLRRRRFA